MDDPVNLLRWMNLPISMYDRRATELALTRDLAEGLSSMAMGQLQILEND